MIVVISGPKYNANHINNNNKLMKLIISVLLVC